MTPSQAAEAIAPLVWAMCEAHRSAQDTDLRAYLDQNIGLMCRHMERFCVPYASDAALAQAEIWGIDLYDLTWRRQTSYDEDRTRIHFEHVYTVGMMKKDVFAAKSVEQVHSVLSRATVAWITHDENRRLTESGYYTKRPEDPMDAYKQVRIVLRSRVP